MHVFQLISWEVHHALLIQLKIWECGLILIFPCPSMFRMSAKVVLHNSMISDMSGSFLLMMLLYLWLMLLLVVSWITATHFSGASPSSIYVNYSASKTVLPELYQTPVDTPALLLCLRNCIGYRLNSARCSRQPHLTTIKFLHTGFPWYLAPYLSSYSSSYSTRRSQSGGNFLVILKFHPSVHKSIKQFDNSFAFDAPSIWKALPDEIRASPSLASFRKQLKTYLYTKAYPP